MAGVRNSIALKLPLLGGGQVNIISACSGLRPADVSAADVSAADAATADTATADTATVDTTTAMAATAATAVPDAAAAQ